MISVEQALAKIRSQKYVVKTMLSRVVDCRGLVLAEDIAAPMNLPPFDNSALDGFVVRSKDLENAFENMPVALKVGAILGAGDKSAPAAELECFRIMTGAKVPEVFDAVVMQEDVTGENGLVTFLHPASVGQNIRKAGEDVRMGQKVLSKGTLLQGRHMGLLLALGISEIQVAQKPRVAIISTGTELIEAGQKRKEAEIYYSNGPMIKAVMENFGAEVISVARVPDDLGQTENAIKNALNADLVVIIGGISVGKYDFVRRALANVGVREMFYKGKWRPGKPLFFGQFESKAVFGLPGNPVAAFLVSHVFVHMCIKQMLGQNAELTWKECIIANNFEKKSGFSLFARAHVDDKHRATILTSQGSHQLGSLARSNAICWLAEDAEKVMSGSVVRYLEIC